MQWVIKRLPHHHTRMAHKVNRYGHMYTYGEKLDCYHFPTLNHCVLSGQRNEKGKTAIILQKCIQYCDMININVFPPDDLSSGPYTQSIIRFFFLYIKLMCPYFILLIYTDGERDGLWMACPFRTLVVLYRMFPFIICLILMNYLMEFYFIGFVNAHLPGCFCPWTFRLNIGLNTSPSDSFVSYLNSHLGYSAGEFQALQLIVLAVFGAVD